jgi:hypothetical protein
MPGLPIISPLVAEALNQEGKVEAQLMRAILPFFELK